MYISTRNKKIDSYLYDNLDILEKFNFFYSDRIPFKPIRHEYTEFDENGNKIHTISADPSIKTRDIDKFQPVILEPNEELISIGIDASTIPSQCLTRGNTRFLLVKPYVICANGEFAQIIIEELSQTIKYLILISDKLNLIYNKSKTALYPHYKLQYNLVNTLKHIKEGLIFANFIEKIVQVAIDYGYKYNSKNSMDQNLIIFKDGSILSNSEKIISKALSRNNFNGLEHFKKLYDSIKYAGEKGIPIVGIVKDSQSLLLSKLFAPFGSDYNIVRNLAIRQNARYSYLNPLKKTMEPYRNIEIDNYFTFIERGISPLRLEVIPRFKPENLNKFNEIIEQTIRLIYQNKEIHEYNNNKYKLPYSILSSDIKSRIKVKEAKQLIIEKLIQIKRKLPIPMKIKQGFD